MNPVIIIAIIAQIVVSKVSKLIAAIMGFLITTGILIWGIGLYADGDAIALFGIIALPEAIFYILCLVWYIADVSELVRALKERKKIRALLSDPILQDENTKRFYQTTQQVWRSGVLNSLGTRFAKEGNKAYDKFIRPYLPFEGSALSIFFKKFAPCNGEYLIGLGNFKADAQSGWFVLTNLRLVQKDGKSNVFKQVVFSEVDAYRIDASAKTIVFDMKSGEQVLIEEMKMYPHARFLSTAMGQSTPVNA